MSQGKIDVKRTSGIGLGAGVHDETGGRLLSSLRLKEVRSAAALTGLREQQF